MLCHRVVEGLADSLRPRRLRLRLTPVEVVKVGRAHGDEKRTLAGTLWARFDIMVSEHD
jgi:hypothetical protein